jgi:hypothetical protein
MKMVSQGVDCEDDVQSALIESFVKKVILSLKEED